MSTEISVLSISLDPQIATGAGDDGRPVLGNPVERQRRYAARLGALHVVAKTARGAADGRVRLADNAWAYPTNSRSRYLFVPDAYRIAAGICRWEHVDVVTAQDPFATGLVAYLVARRFGKPLNIQLHFDVLDNPYWLREKAEHRALNMLGKWLLRQATTVRVGTTREREKLASWGIPRERISYAPVPVDVEQFAGAAPDLSIRAGLWPIDDPNSVHSPRSTVPGRPPDATFCGQWTFDGGLGLVLAVCRLVPQKDLPTLLRAAATVAQRRPGTRFAIAGDGPLLSDLERLAAELGISDCVRFLGGVDRTAVPSLIAAADVLAVSSVYEGTSLATVEAAAAGKPVVTTDIAGAADTVIDGETGRVVPIGDARALAEALMDVLSDRERAARMGAADQAHVRAHFGLERNVERVVEMWQKTAAWGSGAGGRGPGKLPLPLGEGTTVRSPLPKGEGATGGEVNRLSPTRPLAHSPHWLYLANVRVPSEKAHVYQIFQMVDALQRTGVEVKLAHAARANLPGMVGQDPLAYFGLKTRPRLHALPSLDAVKLVTIDVPALGRRPVPALAFGVQTLTFTASAAWHARRTPADVVYTRDWPVLATQALAGAPALFWEAHDLPESGAARMLLRRVLGRVAGVIAITAGLRDELRRLGVPDERLLVAPDAVDLSRFEAMPAQTEARKALGLPLEAPIVVYTGHLYRWKGAHTLALASRRLPDDALVCIVGGTPADVESFRVFVAAHRLERVKVAGHVPPGEVPAWLAAADVVALPNSAKETISARYTSPLKLFEYMAAGRPIVASDLPSLREVLVHGENALLVAPDDPVALAGGLREVLADPALARRLAESAQAAVAERTWDNRARAIVEFVGRARARGDTR